MKLASFILATLLSACGSRSALLVDEAAGAGGTTNTGGTTSSGGIGGTAGNVSCIGLVQKDPIVTLPPSPGPVVSDDYVRLAQLENGEVATVFQRVLGKDSSTLWHGTFSPWNDWPASGSVAPLFSTLLKAGGAHYVAPSPSGGYAVNVRFADGGAVLIPSIDPHTNGPVVGSAISLDGIDAEFLASRSAALGEPPFVAGTFMSLGALLGQVVSSSGPIAKTKILGCASPQPPRAAAVPYQDGWLIAVSSGSTFDQNCSPADPTHIDVVFADATGVMSLVTSIATNDAVVNVDAVPHPDGMYVVWSSSFDGVIRGARIGVLGATLVGPVVLITDPSANDFALATFGKQLAVAHRIDGNVRISVFNENLAEIFLGVSGITGVVALTTALGAPDGSSILVGYTTGPSPFSVHVARFDCEKGT